MTSVSIITREQRRTMFSLPLMESLTVNDAWVLNTYAACDIRCVYCITKAQGQSYPRFPRAAVADRLREELDAIGEIDRMGVGAFCDVYPNVEATERVTRAALEVLADRNLRFNLVTKGTTVVRDIDLFARRGVEVHISLCTVDEDAVSRLEPGAPSAQSRLAALHHLAASGVRVRLQVTPWIPDVSDLAALLDRVDPNIRVTTTPLRLPSYLHRAERTFGLTQRDVNEAFRREYERVGPRPNLLWSRPPALDGSPPHISDQWGTHEITDWTAAAPAPDPGVNPWR
jgi:DNA repair photolyase